MQMSKKTPKTIGEEETVATVAQLPHLKSYNSDPLTCQVRM